MSAVLIFSHTNITEVLIKASAHYWSDIMGLSANLKMPSSSFEKMEENFDRKTLMVVIDKVVCIKTSVLQ